MTVTVSGDYCHCDEGSQYWDAFDYEFDNEFDAYLYAHRLLTDGHIAVLDGYVDGGITHVQP